MSKITRDMINDLLPPGPVWEPEEDGDFDLLLEGIADNYEAVRIFLSTISDVRDPNMTTILSDLEREYGIPTNLLLSEATRRMILASIVYGGPSTGSEDALEAALVNAGFDVKVHQNDPATDPALQLTQAFQMVAGGGNAYAGRADSFAGRLGGELLVNGDIFETASLYLSVANTIYAGGGDAFAGDFDELDVTKIEYPIPTDPNAWPFVFYVGGDKIPLPGSEWVQQTSAPPFVASLQDVCFGNGLHVAVGAAAQIQTSDDNGVTWISRTAGGGYVGGFRSVVFGNNTYVAVGATGGIQTSTDGINWTQQTSFGPFGGTFRAVAFGNGRFVIVGDGGEIQTSSDGVTWAKKTADVGFVNVFFGATYGNGKFVICGQGGEIQLSEDDGENWAHQSPDGGFANPFNTATFGNGVFLLAGFSGQIQTSTDAKAWTQQTVAGLFTGDFLASTYGGDAFIIMGNLNVLTGVAEIQTSIDDGVSWVQQTPDASYVGSFNGVIHSGHLYIAVGDTAEIQASSDKTMQIEQAEIPSERQTEFKTTILKYKPLHSWAALIVTYV